MELTLTLVALTASLVLLILPRIREFIEARVGRVFVFFALFILPLCSLLLGWLSNLNTSTQTRFCLSCHEMGPYGQSLQVDDEEFLAAAHFQHRRVNIESACFDCHRDYAMFGDITTKLNGMKHVWVHIVGPIPEKMTLYKPYPNSNCLHCHESARGYIEKKAHRVEGVSLAQLSRSEISCLQKGCHDVAHNVDEIADLDVWHPPLTQTWQRALGTTTSTKTEYP